MTKNISKIILLAGASIMMMSCSGNKAYDANVSSSEVYDPFENVNRSVFAFNDAVDGAVIHPVIDAYRYAVPKPARSGVTNFLRNLKSPVTLGNQLLQGDLDGAGNVAVRAAVNTFFGVGGLVDVAAHEGIPYEAEDFGQTLAVWGVGHGPYFIVPLIGPTTARDGTGILVDILADPLRMYLSNIDADEWNYVRAGVGYIDLRNKLMDVLRDLEASSLDYYAATRSAYYQSRDALVRDKSNGVPSKANRQIVVDEGYGWDDY